MNPAVRSDLLESMGLVGRGLGVLQAAALRAGGDFSLPVPVVDGEVLLPGMGRAVFAGGVAPEVAPPNARSLAKASLVLWLAAITAGRLMAYVK